MNKKSVLAGIIALTMAIPTSLLSACGHDHTFKEEWSYNAEYHWHDATCKHEDEKGDRAEHSYETVTENNTFYDKCKVCGSIKNSGYAIKLVYAEDGSEVDEPIDVIWKNAKTGEMVAYKQTDGNGFVQRTDLNDDKYLIELDEDSLELGKKKYSYDKAFFNEQHKGVGLIIPIFEESLPHNYGQTLPETNLTVSGRLQNNNTRDVYSISLDKTYLVEFKSKTDEIWYSVSNDGAGKYTAHAKTDADLNVNITRHAAHSEYINRQPDADADGSVKNKLTYTVVDSDKNQTSTVKLSLPDAPFYPISVPFSISVTYRPTYTAVTEATLVKPTHFETEETDFTYTIVNNGVSSNVTVDSLLPAANVEKCADAEGAKITDITKAEYEKMSLKADGYYYTAENKLVYAKINATSIFGANTLATLITAGDHSKYRVAEYESEYKYATKIDNYTGFVLAYNALTNSDGLYPLTEEMHDYLSIVAKKEHREAFELFCTYPVNVKAFTSGSGTEATPYVVNASETEYGFYKLSVPAGGAVFVKINGNEDVAFSFKSQNIKITLGDKTYQKSFPCEIDGSATLKIETVDGGAEEFMLDIDKYEDPSVLKEGINNVEAYVYEPSQYTFTAQEAGEYNISMTQNSLASVAFKDGDDTVMLGGISNGEGLTTYSYSIKLDKGETLIIQTNANAAGEDQFFALTIEKIEE